MLEGINMASLVYLKHKNGTTYVYENVSYWDKKSKNRNQNVSVLDILIRILDQCSQMACVAAIRKILCPNQKKSRPNASLTVVASPPFWIRYVQISGSDIY